MHVVKGSANSCMKMENVKVTNENKITILNFLELVMEDLYQYFISVAYSSVQFARNFCDRIQLVGFLDKVSDKLKYYPTLKVAALGIAACFTIPAALFIGFAIISFLLTFSGFVILEVILLVLGGLCLCACLFSILMVITALALTIGAFHFISTKLKVY